jgi:pimeloyl-ACP methyl ester carboxylesterase
MPSFRSFDGAEIVYDDVGAGPPVLLLHGFAADARVNWVAPGIRDAIVAAGFRTLAPDARGHGRSAKPRDPAAYENDAMARDVSALIDRLGLGQVDVVGYSMGAITTRAAAARDRRIRSIVLGGIGARARAFAGEAGRARRQMIAAALEAADAKAIASPEGRAFRTFADSTGADRLALAALQRARRPHSPTEESLDIPVMVLVGKDDELAGPPEPLAALYPKGRAVTTGGDHLSAVGKPEFRTAIVAFLEEQRGRNA